MVSLRDISPTEAAGDLVSYLREERPYRIPMFLLACLPPAIMISMVYYDALDKAKPPPPEVMYFESWPLTRSIEESKAAITKSGIEKTKQLEAARQAYKELGRASGMDVDAIEREIIAERKAEEAAKSVKAGSGATQ